MKLAFFPLLLVFVLCIAGLSGNLVEDESATEPGEYKEEEKQQTSPFVELFGETLFRWKNNMVPDKDGNIEIEEVSTAQLLNGKKAVAIYFSASWCGPCRQFTPALAKLYKSLNDKGKKFEVVWISRDRSADEFVGYYQKMPWLAVTLQNVNGVLEKLAPKFQLKGIPHLVILDGDDASVITLDGRTAVAKDPYGLEYPWRARTLMNLIPKPIRRIVKAQLESALKAVKNYLRGILEGIVPSKFVDIILGKAEATTGGKTAAPGGSYQQQQQQRGGQAEAEVGRASRAEAQAQAYAEAQYAAQQKAAMAQEAAMAQAQAYVEAQYAAQQKAATVRDAPQGGNGNEYYETQEQEEEVEVEESDEQYVTQSSDAVHDSSYNPDQRETQLLEEAEQYGDLSLSV